MCSVSIIGTSAAIKQSYMYFAVMLKSVVEPLSYILGRMDLLVLVNVWKFVYSYLLELPKY